MKNLSADLMCACLALAAAAACAQDAIGNGEPNPSPKPNMTKDSLTVQDCKAHMAMAKNDGAAKDDATVKMEKKCARMLKKDKGSMKKSDSMSMPDGSAQY